MNATEHPQVPAAEAQSFNDRVLEIIRSYREPISATQIEQLSGVALKRVASSLFQLHKHGRVRRDRQMAPTRDGGQQEQYFYVATNPDERGSTKQHAHPKPLSVLKAVNKATAGLRGAAINAIKQGKYSEAEGILAALRKLDSHK